MRAVHVVLPAGVDDPRRPSGGNAYDLRVCGELADRGWRVVRHEVAGSWPRAGEDERDALRGLLGGFGAGSVVLVDGLVGCAAGDLLAEVASRLRVVLLVHLPLGVAAERGDPGSALERRAVAAATSVLTTSRWTRDWLVEHAGAHPTRVVVARPGTDPAPLTAADPDGGRLLTVGALTPTKGQDRVLSALKGVRDLSWTWACVGSSDGDPPFAEAMRAEVRRAGMGARVRFVGPLAPPSLEEAYAACDLVVVGSRHETYGMVVGEALARGVPVLVTPVGGIGEAMGTTGVGLPGVVAATADAAGLGGALRTWLTDAGLRAQARAAAGSRRTTLSSWSVTLDTIEATLRSVAAGPRTSDRTTGTVPSCEVCRAEPVRTHGREG